jgi:putative membrane protein
MEFHWTSILNAALYSGLGIILFVASFAILDWITPYHLWDQIVKDKNLALAVLLGAMSIGICIIIASAVH